MRWSTTRSLLRLSDANDRFMGSCRNWNRPFTTSAPPPSHQRIVLSKLKIGKLQVKSQRRVSCDMKSVIDPKTMVEDIFFRSGPCPVIT